MKTKKLLHILLTLCTLTPVFSQSPQKGPLKELKNRRTLNSKTFYNQRNNTYTTRISAGDVHYRDDDGKFKEIDTNIRFNKDGSFRVRKGHYRAWFTGVSGKRKYDVIYELPRPVRKRFRKPKKAKRETTRLRWQIRSLGYFDRLSKNYQVFEQAQPVAAVTGGNTVGYLGIFTGVDLRFICGRLKLKQEIVLSQNARNALPDPSRFGIAPDDAFLMVAAEFKLTPNNMKVFARKRDKSKSPVKQGDDFSFEGEDRIEFEDEDDVLQFFFPRDFAFAESDSAQAGQVVRRFFYSERGKHFLLAGVPLSWVQSQPKGTLVIDPSTAAATLDDVWLESAGNFNNHSAGLLVGHAGGGTSKKRTLIEFDLSSAGIPAGATIVKAQLKLKYYDRVQLSGVWVDRNIQAHQLLVDWDEAQANKDNRLSGVAWGAQYGAIDGTDAQSTPESSVLFTFATVLGSWQSWDLTGLTRLWHDGSAPNFGVILLADNEDVVGYDLRFRSSDDGFVDQPVLEVVYTQPTRTVYFLKDHLGSVRATVDDIGQVVGYDDYDPWGYILAGRSMATGASTVTGAAKNKFTGKEYDDEFGLNWYYFVGRPYIPEIGRWVSVDPLLEDPSPYVYVGNNPLYFIDPNGLWKDPINKPQYRGWYASGWKPGQSKFGQVRGKRYHQGADLYAKVGTQTFAVESGTIYKTGDVGDVKGFGKFIVLKFTSSKGETRYAVYAHLESVNVKEEEKVQEGAKIGTTGITGVPEIQPKAGGHLHFEIAKEWFPGTGKIGHEKREDPASYFDIEQAKKEAQKKEDEKEEKK